MKIKVKYVYVSFVNPDIGSESTTYIIPKKNFTSKEQALRYLNRRFGLTNVAVVNIDNHESDYNISEEMIKEFAEGMKNE